ncbi:hypothetical protein CXG81DRAFT_11222 [Caulochytrium protostelioides]|uniref:Chromatin associated protein KTI12 n=1 Tax=Caulochytrium protostelioides TaxID=1555241 RepID=A0A4P9X9R8_9FUNG|nr:hypothetical protein CXG81DRAFT_11222 [Caulochytrium protostelioides]|eukprot:RKP02107.1 hypothetical protein CXG81DRAFT_11222 [Caulochytrium protostelioides]
MPLVTVCGVPCSGKTRRAVAIRTAIDAYLQAHADAYAGWTTVLVGEITHDRQRAQDYVHAADEKRVRGALLSHVERALQPKTIVVCDGLNFIKGFRYQLYCVARALGTTTATVFCAAPPAAARAVNAARDRASERWPDAVLDDLVNRFEEPNGMNRWDAPLFMLLPDDPLPEAELVAALLDRAPPKPNLSTVVKAAAPSDYIGQVDRDLLSVMQAVAAACGAASLGGVLPEAIPVPLTDVPVHPRGRPYTLMELRRLKRQFTQMNQRLTQSDRHQLVADFVAFLNIQHRD